MKNALVKKHRCNCLSGTRLCCYVALVLIAVFLPKVIFAKPNVQLRPRLQRQIAQYSRTGRLPQNPASPELFAAIERVHFLSSLAPKKANMAKRAAIKQAKLLGVNIESALLAPVSFTPSISRYKTWKYRRSTKPPKKELSQRKITASKATHSNSNWWQGLQNAHLDLLYRHLPSTLEKLHQSHRKQLRIWIPGSGYGASAILLAAILDEALERYAQRNHKATEFIKQLKIDIVATDIQEPSKNKKTKPLRIFNFPEPLLLEQLGDSLASVSQDRIQKLEKKFTDKIVYQRDEAQISRFLGQMVDAGKIKALFARFLEPTANVAFGGENKKNDYGLRMSPGDLIRNPTWTESRFFRKDWQIQNKYSNIVINPTAKNRSITFKKSDLTTEAAGRNFDIVFCLNVLPWFSLYGRQDPSQAIGHSLENINRSLRNDGLLVIDDESDPLNPASHIDYVNHGNQGLRSLIANKFSTMIASGKKVMVFRRKLDSNSNHGFMSSGEGYDGFNEELFMQTQREKWQQNHTAGK